MDKPTDQFGKVINPGDFLIWPGSRYSSTLYINRGLVKEYSYAKNWRSDNLKTKLKVSTLNVTRSSRLRNSLRTEDDKNVIWVRPRVVTLSRLGRTTIVPEEYFEEEELEVLYGKKFKILTDKYGYFGPGSKNRAVEFIKEHADQKTHVPS